MQTVRVTKILKAPIDDVFEAFTDHETLADVPGVISAKVITPGTTEKNGLGAIREVNGGLVWLREEITGFERPRLMEYRILRSRPPADHRLGRVQFTPTASGDTEATWTSVFRVPIPVVGWLLEPACKAAFTVVFGMVLRSAEKRAATAAKASH